MFCAASDSTCSMLTVVCLFLFRSPQRILEPIQSAVSALHCSRRYLKTNKKHSVSFLFLKILWHINVLEVLAGFWRIYLPVILLPVFHSVWKILHFSSEMIKQCDHDIIFSSTSFSHFDKKKEREERGVPCTKQCSSSKL